MDHNTNPPSQVQIIYWNKIEDLFNQLLRRSGEIDLSLSVALSDAIIGISKPISKPIVSDVDPDTSDALNAFADVEGKPETTDESVDDDQFVVTIKRFAIPDGFDMPAEDIVEAQIQYLHAVQEIERLKHKIVEMVIDWRNPKHSHAGLAEIVLFPLIGLIADDLGFQGSLSQETSSLINAVTESSAGEILVCQEYAHWARRALFAASETDPAAQVVLSNLCAVELM